MWQFVVDGLLAMGSTPQGAQQNPTAQMLQMLGTILFFFVVMYFLMIRPQQRKARDHANLLKTLKSGDRVVTSGGVLGVVVNVKDKTVSIRSAETKLEVLKTAVSEIVERSGGEEKAQ
jgi:preprotein translocase subunit YajC